MKLRIFVCMEDDLLSEFKKVRDMGFSYCRLSCWERQKYTPSFVDKVRGAVAETGVEITSFKRAWEGPGEWDFYGGPVFITHVGFIPENPNDPDYLGVVYLLRALVERCRRNGRERQVERHSHRETNTATSDRGAL